METETLKKNEIATETRMAVSQIIDFMISLDESKINTIPYEGSWTAGQLLRHVTKSISGMAKALEKEGKPAGRDPGERIQELKKVFLDFSKKMQSPDFIVPEEGPYKKQTAIDELNRSFDQFIKNAEKANVNDLVEGLPLGPITKLEIVHFVSYHTQRHLHQMKKICAALKNN